MSATAVSARLRLLQLTSLALAVGVSASCTSDKQAPPPQESVGTVKQRIFADNGFESDGVGAAPGSPWVIGHYSNGGLTAVPPTNVTQLNLKTGGVDTTTVGGLAALGDAIQIDEDAPEVTYPLFGLRAAIVNHTNGLSNTCWTARPGT
ncbi:MAG: hypothetical protein ACHREM_21460, partial [Polyangiales bacterium]